MPHNIRRTRTRLLVGAAMAALGSGTAFAHVVDLNLPQQTLSDSLSELSLRTGENILFQPEIVFGVRAPALNGRMGARDAIEKLLKGTSLKLHEDGNGSLIIQRESFLEPVRGQIQVAQASQPAPAEAAPPSEEPTPVEQVVVSANRISIAGYDQPTPVTVIGEAQIEKDAFANVIDSLSELPQVTAPPSSSSNTLAGGAPANGGANYVNLRNLGFVRTLVLFDGQRVVASNIAGGVDITTLPTTILSRVDVVTGGASAAWGSDAVAGVVNFVINKNFTGFKGNLQGSDTSNGLYPTSSGEAAWGDDIFGGRGHVEFAVKAEIDPDLALMVNEQWYRGAYLVSNPAYVAGSGQPQLVMANNVGLAQATIGGLITSSPAGTNAPANALRGIEFVGAGNPQLVNFGNVTSGSLSNGGSLNDTDTEALGEPVANPQNTYTFFGYGRYKLTDNIQASLQLNWGYATTKGVAPTDLQTAVTIKSDNAYLPASVAAAMQAGGIPSFTMGIINENNLNPATVNSSNYYAQSAGSLGPSLVWTRRELMRGVFTLEGDINSDWSWNAYYERSNSRLMSENLHDDIAANLLAAEDAVTVTTANVGNSNLPLGSIVCRSSLPGQPAVKVGSVTAQPGCIPLDVFGTGVASAAAVKYIQGSNPDSFDQVLNQEVAEASMQGILPWQLPAGPVAVAFGASYRWEEGYELSNPIGEVSGYATGNFLAYPSVSYNVMEGFGELDAPILKDNVVNSLSFNMAGRMTSYSTSGLVETWKLGLTSQVNEDVKLRGTWSLDIRAPQLVDLYSPGQSGFGTVQDPKTGLTVNADVFTSGNRNLVPEVARTTSEGIVLTPHWLPGLSLSADWYSIDLTDEISTISTTLILNTCAANINSPLCSALVFDGPNGALSRINVSPINFASQTTSGLDLQANYVFDFWQGSLAWAALANYNDELRTCPPGSACDDYAGVMGGGASIVDGAPKWKGVISTTYNAGPYSFTVQGRWFGTGIINNAWDQGNMATAATSNMVAVNEVPFTAYLDLRASYRWNDNIQIYGAIDNVTDVPPPMVPLVAGNVAVNGSIVPTSIASYDVLGRAFRFGIRFTD